MIACATAGRHEQRAEDIDTMYADDRDAVLLAAYSSNLPDIISVSPTCAAFVMSIISRVNVVSDLHYSVIHIPSYPLVEHVPIRRPPSHEWDKCTGGSWTPAVSSLPTGKPSQVGKAYMPEKMAARRISRARPVTAEDRTRPEASSLGDDI
ncbi:hypothetical protein CSOJ01_04618 [Colletotrichum sojae]|uniref:Uncharacterized protein n=1 Tax=Colletotrichum sojae TaxID=2175907 RepID=A0A8H6JHT8_9PEZI|nr:hypothetical protein CSOJ01_04618 [Colletotrichum sojae]